MEPGTNLLHYRLDEKIGEGGMGVVWKATDTTLDREVAIKVLPGAVSQEAERLARFEREAKLLATLNHPNIATVYGLHPPQSGDQPAFIAMEYVAGEDLAARLQRGPLPIDEALNCAQQIAEALEAAHDSGVIHRDLKPANVKLTPDGKIKVLDFGLAKAFDADPMSGDPASPSMSPTVTSAGTAVGVILGTAAYMSPEQAKGKPVDRRADIWAYGALLAEMLTARKLFEADTISETLASVLMTPIDLQGLPEATPVPVRRLLDRCLERDPRRRLRDIGEARILLEDLRSGKTEAEAREPAADKTSVPASMAGRVVPWVVALIAALTAVWFSLDRTEPTAARVATSILPPAGTDFELRWGMELSPDGTRLVFSAQPREGPSRLWIRDLSRSEPRALEGTEDAIAPFWSPDGRYVGFFVDEALKKIDVASGLIETVSTSAYGLGGAWTADGQIVFPAGWGQGLRRVPQSGGPGEVVVGGEGVGVDLLCWPSLLPDGRHVVYLARLYGSAQQTGEIRVASLDGTTDKKLLDANSNAVFVAPDRLLWFHDNVLRSQRFDIGRLELVGSSTALLSDVRFSPVNGRMALTVSDDGLLLYQAGQNLAEDELVFFDRQGTELRTLREAGSYYGPRLSPDGRRVILDISDDTNRGDIWMLDVSRGAETRMTSFSEDDSRARWSPDGRQFIFVSGREGKFSVWIGDSSGGSEPRLLVEHPEYHVKPHDWATSDLIVVGVDTNDDQSIYTYSLADETLTPWVATRFNERAAVASPDGRYAAYVSDESGRSEVWVQAFPVPGARFSVSVNGGDWPVWRSDGEEIYYVDPQDRINAVPVTWSEVDGERVPDFGAPQPLFRGDFKSHGDPQYTTLDGRTFLLNRLVRAGGGEPLTLIQNWE